MRRLPIIRSPFDRRRPQRPAGHGAAPGGAPRHRLLEPGRLEQEELAVDQASFRRTSRSLMMSS